MSNSDETNNSKSSDNDEQLYELPERRQKDRNYDTFYRVVVILNFMSWGLLVCALLLFHYARPEFISGVQKFWGIEGREFWSETHLNNLLTLLQVSLITALVTFILHTRRSRRKHDSLGYNLLFLFAICIVSLVALYTSV